jgi:hypothetical protein
MVRLNWTTNARRWVAGSERLISATSLFVFVAEQVSLAQVGSWLTLRNAKVQMFSNRIRLAVDRWGLIEALPLDAQKPQEKVATEDEKNVSLPEYQLIECPQWEGPSSASSSHQATVLTITTNVHTSSISIVQSQMWTSEQPLPVRWFEKVHAQQQDEHTIENARGKWLRSRHRPTRSG